MLHKIVLISTLLAFVTAQNKISAGSFPLFRFNSIENCILSASWEYAWVTCDQHTQIVSKMGWSKFDVDTPMDLQILAVNPYRPDSKNIWTVMGQDIYTGQLVFYLVDFGKVRDLRGSWTIVLTMDLTNHNADYFYIDPKAEKPYGMIQDNRAKDTRYFFFDPNRQRVVALSGNNWTSEHILKIQNPGQQAEFIQVDQYNRAQIIQLVLKPPNIIQFVIHQAQKVTNVHSLSQNSYEDHYLIAQTMDNSAWSSTRPTDSMVQVCQQDDLLSFAGGPGADLMNLGEYSWITKDDSGRWVVAATSFATQDYFYINMYKMMPNKSEKAEWKLEPWKQKVALVKHSDIKTLNLEQNSLMWIDSQEREVRVETFCSEWRRFSLDWEMGLCVPCPQFQGTIEWQQDQCNNCQQLAQTRYASAFSNTDYQDAVKDRICVHGSEQVEAASQITEEQKESKMTKVYDYGKRNWTNFVYVVLGCCICTCVGGGAIGFGVIMFGMILSTGKGSGKKKNMTLGNVADLIRDNKDNLEFDNIQEASQEQIVEMKSMPKRKFADEVGVSRFSVNRSSNPSGRNSNPGKAIQGRLSQLAKNPFGGKTSVAEGEDDWQRDTEKVARKSLIADLGDQARKTQHKEEEGIKEVSPNKEQFTDASFDQA